jgi:hypothetical protein
VELPAGTYDFPHGPRKRAWTGSGGHTRTPGTVYCFSGYRLAVRAKDSQSMPKEPTPESLEQIKQALFAGRKIEAIKIYREVMHTDLKGAKDFADALEQMLRAESPEKFSASSGASGCLPLMIVLGLILLVVGVAGYLGLLR